MIHVKTALPRFQVANKMMFGLGQLFVTLIGMKAHGRVHDRHAYYPNDPNFTIESLLWLFQIWKKLQFVNEKSFWSTLCKI
jgi:hypothetical protein